MPGRGWQCLECGKRMSLKQAERAAEQGCSGCGSVDVDLAEMRPHHPRDDEQEKDVERYFDALEMGGL